MENGAEENFLHSSEADSLKGSSTPMSTTAIMPSPIILWRFKVLFSVIFLFKKKNVLSLRFLMINIAVERF